LILAIGIPPVLNARLSFQQKAILGVIFGMGTFVIIAAILRAIYCLVPSLISYVYMNWYFREASVAVYVTTLPGIWVFLREIFPMLSKIGTSRKGTKPTSYGNTNNWPNHSSKPTRSNNNPNNTNFSKEYDLDLDTYPISKSMVTTSEQELERGGSHQDEIHGDGSSTSSTRYNRAVNEIRRDVTFTVEHMTIDKH